MIPSSAHTTMLQNTILVRAFALAILPFAFGGCSESQSATRLNLLMIAVDTLRADHLGTYGYQRDTSPNIDRFFADSVVFDEAHSSSSWTLPSFASLVTSHYSSTHGCWQFSDKLHSSFTTLAEVLNDAGYHTAAVVSHVFMGTQYGLAQGFEDYDDSLVFEFKESHEAISSPAISEKVLAFLDDQKSASSDRPWFMFAHFFDPHVTYKRHPSVSRKFGRRGQIGRYDGEIAFTDRFIGQIIDRLEELGHAENTVVAFVADHGEEFLDHGKRGHGLSLYREVERIPLAFRVPGVAARRVGSSVSGVDFMPTVIDLLGLEAPPTPMVGRSLVGLMNGEPADDPGILLETRLDLRPDANIDAYILGKWKLIVETPKPVDEGRADRAEDASPKVMLFNRVDDPGETVDLSTARAQVTERMLRRLREAIEGAESVARTFPQPEELELTRDELERMEALGYIDSRNKP